MEPGSPQRDIFDARFGLAPSSDCGDHVHLDNGAPVIVRFVDEPHDQIMYRGHVVGTDDSELVAQLTGELGLLDEHARAEVFFRDAQQRFVRTPARLQTVEAAPPGANVRLTVSGQTPYTERRRSCRVAVVNLPLFVTVDSAFGCQLLDISSQGLGLICPVKLKVGSLIPVTLDHEGCRTRGHMTVRWCRSRRDGRFRCGLQILAEVGELDEQLRALTMAAHREQLHWLAGVGQRGRGDSYGVSSWTDDAGDALAALTADASEPAPSPDHVDATSSSAPLAAALFLDDHCKNDEDTAGGPRDRRRHRRLSWMLKAVVQLESPDDTRRIAVTMHDISRGGFSFNCRSYIYKDTQLHVDFMIGGDVIRLSGVVAHCRICSGHVHRIGVRLTACKIAEHSD